MNIKYDMNKVEWFSNTIPMASLHQPSQVAMQVESYLSQIDEESLGIEVNSYLANHIIDTKYEKVNISSVIVDHCSHLDTNQ